jgi:hypothetical protein
MTDDEIIQTCGEYYADGTWDDELLGFARLIEGMTLKRAADICMKEYDEAMKRKLYELASGMWICHGAICAEAAASKEKAK